MTVYKYPLRMVDEQTVRLPGLMSEILHVGEQDGQLCLWAAVDPNGAEVDKLVHIRGTGHPLPPFWSRHLGSVVTRQGFVWHVFEGRP